MAYSLSASLVSISNSIFHMLLSERALEPRMDLDRVAKAFGQVPPLGPITCKITASTNSRLSLAVTPTCPSASGKKILYPVPLIVPERL